MKQQNIDSTTFTFLCTKPCVSVLKLGGWAIKLLSLTNEISCRLNKIDVIKCNNNFLWMINIFHPKGLAKQSTTRSFDHTCIVKNSMCLCNGQTDALRQLKRLVIDLLLRNFARSLKVAHEAIEPQITISQINHMPLPGDPFIMGSAPVS